MLKRLYHRITNQPKDIISFIQEDIDLDNVLGRLDSNSYHTHPRPEIVAVLKLLYCIPLTLSERELISTSCIKVFSDSDNPLSFSIIDQKYQTGKTLLASLIAIYELYKLTFRPNKEEECIRLYKFNTTYITNISIPFLERILNNTKSIKKEYKEIVPKGEYCHLGLSSQYRRWRIDSQPTMIIIDEVSEFPDQKVEEILTNSSNIDKILIGTFGDRLTKGKELQCLKNTERLT